MGLKNIIIRKEVNNMNFKKVLSMALVCTMAIACISGCGVSNDARTSDGKVTISVGKWPEKGTTSYETKMEQVKLFTEKYPNIEVVGDTYKYEVNTFTAKATAGTLPTVFPTWFTEVDKIVSAGYAADLTDVLKDNGWLSQMNTDVLKYVSDDKGNVYGIPFKVYAQGLYINKPIFEQAGLVDGNGEIIIPKTYDDVYEAAKTIKEKTGKAGFGFATINNQGGWHTINVAWAHGAEFLSKAEDGKYTSTMNSPETVAAYEWVKKMRAAKVFPDNPNLQGNDLQTLFGAGQLGMFIGEPSYVSGMVKNYGIKPEAIIMTSMPEGPKGSNAQMGGDLYMIAANATPEQIDASLKWIDFVGHGPTLTDETIQNLKKNYETTIGEGGVVLPRDAFYLWTDEDSVKKHIDARKEFVNIPESNLETYYAFEGVTLMPEPEAGCQELYAELDKVVQEIYSDPDVDVSKMVKEASDNWQLNCLDNLK